MSAGARTIRVEIGPAALSPAAETTAGRISVGGGS